MPGGAGSGARRVGGGFVHTPGSGGAAAGAPAGGGMAGGTPRAGPPGGGAEAAALRTELSRARAYMSDLERALERRQADHHSDLEALCAAQRDAAASLRTLWKDSQRVISKSLSKHIKTVVVQCKRNRL